MAQLPIHPPLPSSSASSTDFETIQGQMTLAQFIAEIELIAGSRVYSLTTGRRSLAVYRQHAQPPMVPLNLLVNAAVAQREAHSVTEAQARTAANLAVGRHRISPKRAERVNNTICFDALCEDNETYSVSWCP